MKEQKYIIGNIKSFEPVHIFECGQCFRWNKDDEGYTGIFGNNVINVKKVNNNVIFTGICEDDIEKVCRKYFDLDTDYELIKDKLSQVDEFLKNSIQYGSGLRILNQDLWETIISFIISANNNIPRIKSIIERISKKYGKEILYQGKEFYTFPNMEELSKASIQDLRDLGLGFRDKRVYETTRMFLDKKITLEELEEEKNTEKLREKLMSLPGVGRKVADCVMLFSLKRFDVFPIDVWVRRVMNELYIKEKDENKVQKEMLQELAREKFGNLSGIAQQYLFYWKRDS